MVYFSAILNIEMRILGIESSCDETAAAVVQDGSHLLSNVVHTQIDIHAKYGGVVPEVAARSHIETIIPVIDQALGESNSTWDDIDAIAVTHAPGLSGSLLIGATSAKTIAHLKNKPLLPIHHVQAHVYASFITEQSDNLSLKLPAEQPEFPLLTLIVSGGHSQLVIFHSHENFEILGQTQDDAVGEAFDKVAKILGLPYPGGPSISRAAESGNEDAYVLPISRLDSPYNFSFSGLKTAVLRAVQKEMGVDFTFPSHELKTLLNDVQRCDFAASFQKAAVEALVRPTVRAIEEFNPKSLVVAGGVAANLKLRQTLESRSSIKVTYPPVELCTDNAAMVASLAYFQAKHQPASDPLNLDITPSMSMSEIYN